MTKIQKGDLIPESDEVVRVIFSPKMIMDDHLLPDAFKLDDNKEKYLSVLWVSINTWENDIFIIPENEERKRYGYAKLEVANIVNPKTTNIIYEVKYWPTKKLLSHSGIFISVNGEKLIGGKKLETVPEEAQEPLLLRIKNKLRKIAEKNLVKLQNESESNE